MRLAVVAPGFQAHPGDPFVPYWADRVRLLARDHEVVVFPLRYPTHVRRPYQVHGAEVVPLGLGSPRLRASPARWATAVRAITAYHRRQPFDLIDALRANEAGLVGALAAARNQLPLVVRADGGELVWLPELGYGSQGVPWERLAVRLTLARASAMTVGCRALAQEVRQALGPRCCRVAWAPHGVDTARFGPAAWPERPRLLHVGDLNPVKGQALLLEAFAQVLAALPGARLDIVGGGPALRGLVRLARSLGVDRRLRWWGQVPHGAMPLAYGGASAFAFASWHEGQSLALTEAAAAGLPIASTPVGLAPDLPAVGVHLAPAGDTQALAAAMLAALAPEGREAARRALRNAAERDYPLDACIERLVAVFRRVLADRR